MHISAFIRKWKQSTLKERSGSQEHFLDLCAVLGQPKPADVDPDGSWYTFEKGAQKHSGGQGFADVWKKGYFAWEYKGKSKDLDKAYNQLLQYRGALENPPLLVVSDMETIEIHTNFTNTPEEVHTLRLEELDQPQNIDKLKWLFINPERFKPGTTSEQITTEVARKFAELAQVLRNRNHDPHDVAHFLSKIVFCLFAEDVGLLPKHILSKMIVSAGQTPERFNSMLGKLLSLMNTGGDFGVETIHYFNGGLFNDNVLVPLEAADIQLLQQTSKLDWSAVEPSILGTLFERGLDPSKRSQLGAHYTPRSDIERIIDAVMMKPLEQEWYAICRESENALAKAEESQNKGSVTKAIKKSRERIEKFLKQVRAVRVLDPACGSGNFLYIALEKLHDLEKLCMVRLADLEGGQLSPYVEVGPHQVMGIELNPYAAELAKVTIWIGHLQWMIQNGFGYADDPVLQNLEAIRNMDAIIDLSAPENALIPEWPAADYIVGNPPFLGGSKLRLAFGDDYYEVLRKAYGDRLGGGADLVCYWFERARQHIHDSHAKRAGFISTQAIRMAANQDVLKRIKDSGSIFWAESDRPWILDGADVRVSMLAFDNGSEKNLFLDGLAVEQIHSDLSGQQFDLTKAIPLIENKGIAFVGSQKIGAFDITAEQATNMLKAPKNPNGRSNSDVLKPSVNGSDLMGQSRNMWIIDFGISMTEGEAEFYELPFEYISEHVKPERLRNRREAYAKKWWRHGEARPGMRLALQNLQRFIVTSRVAKHRVFAWLRAPLLPDNKLCVFAREDDASFGLIHSRFHELWSLEKGSVHGDGKDGGRPVYNVGESFETFPFPDGLTPDLKPEDYSNPHAEAIAAEARRLNELRENWLNPSDLIKRVPEVVPGYPERILPKDEDAAKELKKRTLTNLYNQKPAWLFKAHQRLDAAVAAAYGWPADLSDDEILRRLFELNQARAQAKTLGTGVAAELAEVTTK